MFRVRPPIKPADVAFVQVEIQCAQDADAMQAGRDEVTQRILSP